MATLVLSVAAQAIGASIAGPAGAVIGRAAGAIAGQFIDSALFGGGGRTVERGRLADLEVQASTEGAPLPMVYGRVRLAGQVIWATRFEEVVSEERQGSKGGGGGTTVRSYAYFGNFAIALCEGPIERISRIWADGKPLDLTGITSRIYLGDEDQDPDPLIEAKQGEAPAYRGTAYMVFERLPLEPFGNRLPQLSVEVVRVVDRLEKMVRAVTVIPAATEFGYADTPVRLTAGPGASASVNRHVAFAPTDWEASLDELTALCPNLESVALAVAWFGDDLRCGACEIRPAVEDKARLTAPMSWRVAGLTRGLAQAVSRVDGRPAYGGTPDDASVIAAIRDLKARGLRVMLLPFLMMDVAAGNGLDDPYGGAEQAAYPWRGRITCHPAPGEPASPDKTPAAATQVGDFMGSAAPSDFYIANETVNFTGGAEWSYRRFILHYAHLAAAAGGVDAFLVGSEMRALARVRDGAASYPFVAALQALATDVRAVLGPATKLSYAADWSDYFGHQPADGTSDVFFHLDPLWAAPEIDFVGIDNYMPLADWRDGEHADADGFAGIHDPDYIRANVAGGEGFDWYYAGETDRLSGTRTPITDGAHGKPWVFRFKDLVSWWSSEHHDRPGGVEAAMPTAWVPMAKPIWFTELGAPAVDRGANQPNVFVDAKSAESALPRFSNGGRDDFGQRRTLEAVLSWWSADHPDWPQGDNPISPLYGGPMVDPANLHLWTWDARPWPAFPLDEDAWSDGVNWARGHWLNGRLGGAGTDAVIRAVLSDFGVAAGDVAVESTISDHLDGFTVLGPTSARVVLEDLAAAFGFVARDTGTALRFSSSEGKPTASYGEADLAEEEADAPLFSLTRAQESELPGELRLTFSDPLCDYARVSAASRRLGGSSRRVEARDLAVAAYTGTMQKAAEERLRDAWAGRNRAHFALPPAALAHEPGDLVEIVTREGARQLLRIAAIEDGTSRRMEAVSADPTPLRARPLGPAWRPPATVAAAGPPVVEILDLPLLSGAEPPHAVRVAAFAKPWLGGMTVWRSASGETFEPVLDVELPATIGELTDPLAPAGEGYFDRANALGVRLYGGALSARAEIDVFGGANAAAVRCANGDWEVIQFGQAQLVAADTWRLSGLLRAQAGSDEAMRAGAATGAAFVLLDARAPLLDPGADRLGVEQIYRTGPRGRGVDDAAMTETIHAARGAGLKPLSPVHLAAAREAATGDILLTWIRRTRVGGDSWQQVEVPLGEDLEAYQVDVLDGPGGTVLRTLHADATAARYQAADQIADFGASPATISVTVQQLSATLGRGTARSATFDV